MAIAVESRPGIQKPEVDSFTVHQLDPQKDSLFGLGPRLVQIGRMYYREREERGRKLMEDLRQPLNAVILLGDPKRLLIGYAYAACELLDANATVREVAIDPDIHEVGGVEKLMIELEEELLKRGVVTIAGSFPAMNSYADRIADLYSGRLLEDREEGLARFLKVGLVRTSNVVPFPIKAA